MTTVFDSCRVLLFLLMRVFISLLSYSNTDYNCMRSLAVLRASCTAWVVMVRTFSHCTHIPKYCFIKKNRNIKVFCLKLDNTCYLSRKYFLFLDIFRYLGWKQDKKDVCAPEFSPCFSSCLNSLKTHFTFTFELVTIRVDCLNVQQCNSTTTNSLILNICILKSIVL